MLHLGIWESADVAAGAAAQHTVLALHGITSSHLAWSIVASELTATAGTRVIAPDLRGRGGSSGLPGPWGMAQHADDAAAALDTLRLGAVTVVGHSMGGFAAVVFAHRHADRTAGLLLVDGGVPLAPAELDSEQALAATLGPAQARLSMTFGSAAEYRAFWRRHPAFTDAWSPAVIAYVDYDLEGAPPQLRSRCRYEAVAADAAELSGDSVVLDAWEELARPVTLLRAPAGLLGDAPLYPEATLTAWQHRMPILTWRDVPGVNHYTITLSDRGARAVATHLRGS